MEKTLFTIVVNQTEKGIKYKVECANNITSDELAHFLDEIIEGICTWKPGVCQETVETIVGVIKEK